MEDSGPTLSALVVRIDDVGGGCRNNGRKSVPIVDSGKRSHSFNDGKREYRPRAKAGERRVAWLGERFETGRCLVTRSDAKQGRRIRRWGGGTRPARPHNSPLRRLETQSRRMPLHCRACSFRVPQSLCVLASGAPRGTGEQCFQWGGPGRWSRGAEELYSCVGAHAIFLPFFF
jgi:hypothetical protein